jgi:hypothetical protein
MDRVAVTNGTKNGNAGIVDRLADKPVPTDSGTRRTPAIRTAGVEPVLSRTTETPTETSAESPRTEAEVMLQQLWFELPVSDRQRFGHCFSCMVLKALGLRPCPNQEVKA